jgi:succinate dehydrogenase / fumarate reductase flavoprotein subunit
MMDHCGIFRNGEGLQKAKAKIQELKERSRRAVIDDKGSQFNTDVLEAIELENLVDTAEVVVECALNRTESRGAHSREDFPDRNDTEWLKHTMAYQGANGRPEIGYKDVVLGKYKPKARVY